MWLDKSPAPPPLLQMERDSSGGVHRMMESAIGGMVSGRIPEE